MTYEYKCEKCDSTFDVIKSVQFIDEIECCKLCANPAIRSFVPSRLYLNGTSVQHAEFNPGLGCIVRNKAHREELCKIKGVEEIGNEKPESIHKHFDKAREETWEKSWEDTTKGWQGDGT